MAIEEKKDVVEEEIVETEQVENNSTNSDESNSNNANENDSSKESENTQSKGAKTFTQEQVSKMMAREKNQGRAAALRELGIDPKDTKTIALLQSVLKGKSKNETEESGNDTKYQEMERRTLVAEAKAEAMQQGAQASFVDDIVTLALSKMEEGSDLATVVGEVKTKYPVWFGENKEKDKEDQEDKKTGQKGTGSSVKSKSSGANKKEEAKSLGARLAAQRKMQNTNKKSFWN